MCIHVYMYTQETYVRVRDFVYSGIHVYTYKKKLAGTLSARFARILSNFITQH